MNFEYFDLILYQWIAFEYDIDFHAGWQERKHAERQWRYNFQSAQGLCDTDRHE